MHCFRNNAKKTDDSTITELVSDFDSASATDKTDDHSEHSCTSNKSEGEEIVPAQLYLCSIFFNTSTISIISV
jgi:hypothetical protein